MAESQQKYLFGFTESNDKRERIQGALRSISQTLETLETTLSVQSFILAVDPFNPSDDGFLGGTTTGREFWRGLRGGGAPGALAFKEHCRVSLEPQPSIAGTPPFSAPATPKSKKTPASLLKSEVYAAVRAALRFVPSSSAHWFGLLFIYLSLVQQGERGADSRDAVEKPRQPRNLWRAASWMACRCPHAESIHAIRRAEHPDPKCAERGHYAVPSNRIFWGPTSTGQINACSRTNGLGRNCE